SLLHESSSAHWSRRSRLEALGLHGRIIARAGQETKGLEGCEMNHDIDAALKGWDYKPGVVQARLVQAQDGRQVIQLRVDLGLLQIETAGRPDGVQPHGCETYFEHLRKQAQVFETSEQTFTL